MAMLYELDEVEKGVLMGTTAPSMKTCSRCGNKYDTEKVMCPDCMADPHRLVARHRGHRPTSPRPGERVQRFWCDGCRKWHQASVLGGVVGEPHKRDKG